MFPDIGVGLPMYLILPLIVWFMIWKGIALWKAGRNNQLTWFVVMFLVNSAGILPIVYIFWFQKNKTVLVLPKVKQKKPIKKAKKK